MAWLNFNNILQIFSGCSHVTKQSKLAWSCFEFREKLLSKTWLSVSLGMLFKLLTIQHTIEYCSQVYGTDFKSTCNPSVNKRERTNKLPPLSRWRNVRMVSLSRTELEEWFMPSSISLAHFGIISLYLIFYYPNLFKYRVNNLYFSCMMTAVLLHCYLSLADHSSG